MKTIEKTSEEEMAVLCNACLEVIANALGTTWEELKKLLQEEERLDKLRQGK
jgi:hypothetical protein